MSIVKDYVAASVKVKQQIINDTVLIKQIERLGRTVNLTLCRGNKIIFAGNGGSFADAQHITAEFISKLKFDRHPLAAITLGTNSSIMTACANDYGYEHVFSRELSAISKSGDLFIPISTSGNSKNLLLAVQTALKNDLEVIALTGRNGGELKNLCEAICVPSETTAHIQEAHIMIGHLICGLGEASFIK